MSRITTLAVSLASAACLALCSWAGPPVRDAAPDDPSGAPPGWSIAPVHGRALPDALDDLLQPRRDDSARSPRADWSDLARMPQVPAEPGALWKELSAIDPARRASATLEVEPGAAPTATSLALIGSVSRRWNAGEHGAAINALRAFEDAGGRCAIGITWKPGSEPAMRSGTDVRIGGARTDCRNSSLDFHAASGRLFAVVRWGGTTGTSAWTVNVSSDGGATWTESYAFASSVGLLDASAVVVGDYLYVGYVVGNATTELRLRRFLAPSGASDVPYAFHVVLDGGAIAFRDVAVASNAEDFDNRVYAIGIQSDHALRFAWDVSTDGLTFTEVATGVASADSALDASWGNGSACSRFIYISYVDTDGLIHMASYGTAAGWATAGLAAGSAVRRPTAISVRDTTIICAYEYSFTEGNGIRYSISYDCGSTWNWGTLAAPDGVAVSSYMAPDLDARDPHGTAATYAAEAGEPDPALYRYRWGYQPGQWEDELSFNEHDVLTGTPTTIAHLPRLAAHTMSHGAIYFSGSPVPYFDYPGLGVVGAPPAPPAASLALRFAGEHPARGGARLELTLPSAGHLDVRVFDVRGARVRELRSGDCAAGVHALSWDGTRDDGAPVAPGVYLVRAHTARGEAWRRVVMLR